MTATNFLTFGNGAVLFSDTAIYDEDMRITRFASKVRTPDGGKLGIITSGSRLLGDKLVEHLERHAAFEGAGPLTFDLTIEYLPDCISVMNAWLDEMGADRSFRTGRALVEVVLVGWSGERGEWIGASVRSWSAGPDEPAGTPVFERQRISPNIEADGRGRQPTAHELMENLDRLGRDGFVSAVLNQQRRTALVFDRHARRMADCIIGGEAEFVVMMADQTVRKTVHSWGDAVGDDQAALRAKVQAEPHPAFGIRKSRAQRRREERGGRAAA